MVTLVQRTGASLGDRLPAPGWRTRFAPAPTGYLHLGHLVNALHVWGLARAFGGHVILRIEDHDRTRCRPEYETALLDDLEWLGFVPDHGDIAQFRLGATPGRQSDNGAAYDAALTRLGDMQRVYACTCSRRDILAIAGPTVAGEEAAYPGTCRHNRQSPDGTRARRVVLDDGEVRFEDLALGPQQQIPSHDCGDVLVRDRLGHPTYQFAVVVDDLKQGIDVVIRGEDLLASTGRQIMLAHSLGRGTPPLFYHHALIRHADGRKLSKAAHDTSLRELRASGADADSLIGEAAKRAGLLHAPDRLAASDVAQLFA